MDIFMTDGRTERRTNYIKALSAPIMHNYARAHSSHRFALPRVLLTRWPFCHSTLTWSEFEWTFLYVHGEIREIHGTAGFNCQSTGVEHASVLIDAHKLIRGGYRVQIALFAIVKIRIRLPDARQHRDGQRQCVLCALEGKTLIHPGLTKITVHRVGLQAKREKRAWGANWKQKETVKDWLVDCKEVFISFSWCFLDSPYPPPKWDPCYAPLCPPQW